MFYSQDFLTRKGSELAVVWMAATFGTARNRRLTRRDYCQVDIRKTCEFVAAPPEPMALRLSSSLMFGIARVYHQQFHFYSNDVQQMLINMRKKLASSDAELMLAAPEAKLDAITIQLPNLPALHRPMVTDENAAADDEELVALGWIVSQDDAMYASQSQLMLIPSPFSDQDAPIGQLEVARAMSSHALMNPTSAVDQQSSIGLASVAGSRDPTLLMEPIAHHPGLSSHANTHAMSTDLSDLGQWVGLEDVAVGTSDADAFQITSTHDMVGGNTSFGDIQEPPNMVDIDFQPEERPVQRRKRRRRQVINPARLNDETTELQLRDFIWNPRHDHTFDQACEAVIRKLNVPVDVRGGKNAASAAIGVAIRDQIRKEACLEPLTCDQLGTLEFNVQVKRARTDHPEPSPLQNDIEYPSDNHFNLDLGPSTGMSTDFEAAVAGRGPSDDPFNSAGLEVEVVRAAESERTHSSAAPWRSSSTKLGSADQEADVALFEDKRRRRRSNLAWLHERQSSNGVTGSRVTGSSELGNVPLEADEGMVFDGGDLGPMSMDGGITTGSMASELGAAGSAVGTGIGTTVGAESQLTGSYVLEDETKQFYLYALQMLSADPDGDTQETTNGSGELEMDAFLPEGSTRDLAAEVFHHLLALGSTGYLKFNQQRPYGLIYVSAY